MVSFQRDKDPRHVRGYDFGASASSVLSPKQGYHVLNSLNEYESKRRSMLLDLLNGGSKPFI